MQITAKSKTRKQAVGFAVFVLFGFFASGMALKMEFSSQAPEGNWSEPWYNDCEEVSIAMVDSFYNNRTLTNAVAKKEILRILDIKEKAFGPSIEEDAEKIVDLVNNFLNSNWKARIVENPTIEQIKEQINNNNPVILPVDGRKLNNRYYTTTHYHVFAISGYDDDKKAFVTQDPGTYRDKNYQYSYAVIESAMHDYNSEDLSKGRKVAIFTSREIKKAESTDAGDGEVKKADESEVKTALVLFDIGSDDSIKGNESEINVLPAVSEKSAEYGGLAKRIWGYWANLIERIKKTYRGF
ncbi:MAG: C39 family peptidase [Patescibacteria group bacterium]